MTVNQGMVTYTQALEEQNKQLEEANVDLSIELAETKNKLKWIGILNATLWTLMVLSTMWAMHAGYCY